MMLASLFDNTGFSYLSVAAIDIEVRQKKNYKMIQDVRMLVASVAVTKSDHQMATKTL